MHQRYSLLSSYTCLILLAGFSFILFSGAIIPTTKNRVYGRVSIPQGKRTIIGQSNSYDASSHSAKLMSVQNSVVIFYPLDFQPSLPPTPNAVITQKAETFIPIVTPITRGSTVYILNEDNQYHNVYSRTPRASFNIGRRPPGAMYPQRIQKSGIVKLFCDIHDHMQAFVLSLDTPYFTRVRRDGSYDMPNLPDGRYRVDIFHPKLSQESRVITLSASSSVQLNFSLRK